MTSHLHALCFDAHDPLRLARFWADFLCWETSEDSGLAARNQRVDGGSR
ncbi:VOC family protein [Streptomyces sp. NPDC057908]